MTERVKVNFKVYSTSTAGVFSSEPVLPYNQIAFNNGGGTYNTATYEYTIPMNGTYLLGLSFNKANGSSSVVNIFLRRGTEITNLSSTSTPLNTFIRTTVNKTILYTFEANDVIYAETESPLRLNFYTPPSGSIYTSFWGIRLDYV